MGARLSELSLRYPCDITVQVRTSTKGGYICPDFCDYRKVTADHLPFPCPQVPESRLLFYSTDPLKMLVCYYRTETNELGDVVQENSEWPDWQSIATMQTAEGNETILFYRKATGYAEAYTIARSP